MMSEKDLARVKLVKLARKQRQLNEKLIEWKMAKELLGIKKREAGLKSATPDIVEVTPKKPLRQPPVDLTHSDSSQKADEDEIGEQWQREQDQNRVHGKPHTEPEILETSPADDEDGIPFMSNKIYQPFTISGASRPRIPRTTLPREPNTASHSSKHGATPTMPTSTVVPANPIITTPTKTKSPKTGSPKNAKDVDFATLPANGPLPNTSAGGDPLKWTIQRRTSLDQITGAERAEYAIDIARLEGESKSAKNRRVKRERAVVEEWAKVTGSGVLEWDGRTG